MIAALTAPTPRPEVAVDRAARAELEPEEGAIEGRVASLP